MATEQIPTSIIADDAVTTAKVADDAITGALIENNPTIAGTLGVTGALTASGGIANAGTISAGTIGSNVTIADGASPHGWQHIGTKHYNTNTSPTDTSYYPLVNEAGSTLTVSSEFSAYKIYFQVSGADGTHDLYLRFMTGASAYYTSSNYIYYLDYKEEGGNTGNFANSGGSGDVKLFLATDVFQNAGSRGYQGEICIWNCYASNSAIPTIDGNAYPIARNNGYMPHGYSKVVSHNNGVGDQLVFGGFRINADTHVTGFALYFESNATMYQGSWTSLYGLKLA